MGYNIQALDKRTWLIEESGECNVYMYLLTGDERAVLIDAGYGTIPLDKIVGSLTALPVTVLCTHGHFDHIGGIGYFPQALMHRADRELYHRQLSELSAGTPAPAKDPVWFDGSFTLDLGNRTLEIFPVPGHTRGCVAILDAERRQLFTGDTCCKGAVLLHFDHSADLFAYRESIAAILQMGHRFDRTWPSHHEKPVGAEIPAQFLEGADLLLSGSARGEEIPGTCGRNHIFTHRDIEILY